MTTLRYLGYALGAVFVCISVAANARYGVKQGHDDFDKTLYFFTALGLDGLKVLVPMLGTMCLRKGQKLFGGIAWAMWAASLAYSLSGALGWSVTSRSNVSAEKTEHARVHREKVAERDAFKSRIDKLPQHRPAAIVQAAIDATFVPNDVRTRTDGCRAVKRQSDGETCAPLLALRSELAIGTTETELAAKLEAVQDELDKLKAPAADADPQAQSLVGWVGPDPATVRVRLSVLLALLVEAAAALIFTITWLATTETVTGPRDGGVAGRVTEAVAGKTAPGGGTSRDELRHTPVTAAVSEPVAELVTEAVAGKKLCTSTDYPRHTASATSPATQSRHGAVVEVVTAPRHKAWRSPPPDAVEAWAAHRLDVAPGDAITCSAAYDDFVVWSGSKGAAPLSGQHFGMQAEPIIARMGGRKVKRRDARYFEGVALNAKDST